MRKKDLLRKIKQLEDALSLKQKKITELITKNNKQKGESFPVVSVRVMQEIHGRLSSLVDENNEMWDEICKLKEKVLSLQRDKEGLIECVKQKRYMLSCADDEVKHLNEIIEILNSNIEAQNTIVAQNDMAYYEMLKTNSFLAGKLTAYENMDKRNNSQVSSSDTI